MEWLRALASIRSPFGDQLVSIITLLGEETVFMVAGLIIFWCFSKKWGYRFMIVGLSGSVLNQLLKAIFLIPRPWVLDPSFTIVEAAREGASGYSFPSGHTQSAATVFGTLAAWIQKRWVTAVCVALVLLVGFSRMYLGVHTPLDVGVSLATGLLTVVLLVGLLNRQENSFRGTAAIWLGALAFALVLVLYVHFAPVTERNIAEFDAHGVSAAWKLFGSLAGMFLVWWVDERHLRFEVKAAWWAQVLKVAIGLGLVLIVRIALKPVLISLTGSEAIGGALRYFLMVMVGGVLWPMSFRFWSRTAK